MPTVARLVVHQGNSLELAAADLIRLAGGKLRIVSVDGGHTAEIAAHDLAVAEAALAEGGIIVVDDVFNEQWPGVGDGVHRYFSQRRDLVPFAIGANKTYFCRPSHRDAYRAAAVEAATDGMATDFLGEPVVFLQFERPRLKDRIAASAAWQSTAHDAHRPAAALGMARRPHGPARPHASRKIFRGLGRAA